MDSSAPTTPCALVRLAVLLMTALSVSAAAWGQQPWHEGFETAQTSWQEAGGDGRYRVHQHQRIQNGAHGGNGCEWIRLEAEGSSYVYFSHNAGRAAVFEELVPSVWMRSDRSGLQLAVQIVLPRTIDSRTGRPLVTRIAGPSYTDTGHWQSLRFDGIARLLTRQVRELRMERGPQVDSREAYVDAILLNVYGGPGVTNVWIDDLDIAGFVTANGQPNATPPAIQASATGAVAPAMVAEPKRRAVRLDHSILLADERPIFPRAVQHRGEPLELLKRLGFNVVWLQRIPAPEMLDEANRLGLWLVCPPPRPASNDSQSEPTAPDQRAVGSAPMAEIGPQFDCVLAWNLGDDLSPTDLETTRRWADQIRAADQYGRRPLICRPTGDLRGFSYLSNLLLIDRRPLGTSLDLGDWGQWLRKQPLLARPGTAVWTTVQTQPSEALRQQLALLEPGVALPSSASSEQIRLLVYTAIAANSRGLLFLSDTPLDASDAATRQRAATLELLNLEIARMEPWAAAGSFAAAAEAKTPEVAGTVLRTERGRLLLPIWSAVGAQWVVPQSAVNDLSLLLPGVPEANNAYEITPRGLLALSPERVTGGMRVTLKEFGLTTQVLLANDPLVINWVDRHATQTGRRSAELQRQLAWGKFNAVRATAALLARRTSVPQATTWLDAAFKNLSGCDAQLAAGDVTSAALNAQRGMRALRLVERAYWDEAVKELASPMTSPGATSFDTLPIHWRMLDRIKSPASLGPNLLVGSDFENIDAMQRAGWRSIQRPTSNVQSAADLIPDAAHSGARGLRLVAMPENPEQPPAVIEMAPLIFATPDVPVEAGQIVCIHGWVNVPKPIEGNVDGLMIVDSLSGEALAERVQRTSGWREFAMYRVVPQSGPLSVIFALSGMNEAWIDDVAIRAVQPSAVMTRR